MIYFHHARLSVVPSDRPTFVSHVHSRYEIVQLTDGALSYIIDGKHYIMESGDVILVDSNQFHMIELHKAPYERRVIEFETGFTDSFPTLANQIKPLFTDRESCVIKKETATEVNTLFNFIENAVSRITDKDNLDSCISLDTLRLLLEIKNARNDASRAQKTIKSNPLVDAAVDYIKEHLNEKITLNDLERYLHVSQYHFSHLFKKNIGTSVMNYINTKKIKYAEELIAGGANPTQVSLILGYKSYSGFFNLFKRITNLLPSDVRRST
ncbi:MAG: AraC family transcriptional regulator [Firmicutes bacterium]|nr:AraC family transcriptional regulator [Bacillota bacterium]